MTEFRLRAEIWSGGKSALVRLGQPGQWAESRPNGKITEHEIDVRCSESRVRLACRHVSGVFIGKIARAIVYLLSNAS